MAVNIRHHIHLCMTRVSLYCFDITAVQLQFVGNTGVPKTVKYNFRQIVILDQFLETFADGSFSER